MFLQFQLTGINSQLTHINLYFGTGKLFKTKKEFRLLVGIVDDTEIWHILAVNCILISKCWKFLLFTLKKFVVLCVYVFLYWMLLSLLVKRKNSWRGWVHSLYFGVFKCAAIGVTIIMHYLVFIQGFNDRNEIQVQREL